MKLYTFLIVVFSLFACTALDQKVAKTPSPLRIKFIKGNIRVLSDKGLQKAKIGQVLSKKDRIFTSEKSRAEIIIGNRGVIKIGPKTKVEISEISGIDNLKAALSVRTGSVFSGVRKLKSKESFEVRTPSAVAGVRGTTFITDVENPLQNIYPPSLGRIFEQAKTNLKVLSGTVALTDHFGSMVLVNKLESIVASTQKKLIHDSIVPLDQEAFTRIKALLVNDSSDSFTKSFMASELKNLVPREIKAIKDIGSEVRVLNRRKKVEIKKESSTLENEAEEELEFKHNKTW